MNSNINKSISKFERHKEEVIRLRNEGLGSQRIAKEVGVSRSTVHSWLKKLGMSGHLNKYKEGFGVNDSVPSRTYIVPCVICDTEIETRRSDAKYCSDACMRADKNKRYISKCRKCGCPILFNRKVCEGCKEYDKALKGIVRAKKDVDELVSSFRRCTYCNEPYFKRNKYCSERCMHRSYYEKTREFVYHTRQCIECSREFETTHSKTICCSEECKNRRANRTNYLKRKTIIKENGKANWNINIKMLSERDKSICYLCRGKVKHDDFYYTDEGYFVAGDSYPSVDHVKPISKGGTHTWDNVKLAHRLCNSIKHNNETIETKQPELQNQ